MSLQLIAHKLNIRRGVLNVVHGTHHAVNSILDHPDIKAISFVGSDKAGRYIYEVSKVYSFNYLPPKEAFNSLSLNFVLFASAHTCAQEAFLFQI